MIFLTQPQQLNPRALGYSLARNILGNGIKESFSKYVTNRLNLPIKVRITHLPGDQRFPGGKILKAGYGYISNHYAPQDKKSLDCYVSHQLLLETDKNSANYPIFMVHQIIPESGDLDEYKIMLGFNDIDTAKEAYLNCAPSFRFGKIEKITPDFLSTFQRPVSLAEGKAKKCVVGYPCSRACISTNKNCRNKLNPNGESYNFAKWVTTHLSLGGNLTKQQLSKADETTGGSLSKLLATKDMPLPKTHVGSGGKIHSFSGKSAAANLKKAKQLVEELSNLDIGESANNKLSREQITKIFDKVEEVTGQLYTGNSLRAQGKFSDPKNIKGYKQ